jgi:hypothetical protein
VHCIEILFWGIIPQHYVIIPHFLICIEVDIVRRFTDIQILKYDCYDIIHYRISGYAKSVCAVFIP